MRKLFLSLLVIAGAFASCRKDTEEKNPFLTVTQTDYVCESTATTG